MKKQFLMLACMFLALVAYGQANKVTLTGTIEVNSGEVFPYKVVFAEINGVVKGYSVTYSEPDDTKATIVGTFDRRANRLDFKETEIVYSHGVQTKAYMCLVDAQLEQLRNSKGNVLKGPITSMQADKTACTGGRIIFSNQVELKNLFDTHEQYDTVISMKKKGTWEAPVQKEKNIVPAEPQMVTDKITTGVEKTYDWHSDTIIIDIWDGGNTDGDKVTMKYNGKIYLDGYTLIKQKKRLRIPVSATGTDVLTIVADNEGSDPPNTASLMLMDGPAAYSVLSYNNKGQVSMIKIKRVGKR